MRLEPDALFSGRGLERRACVVVAVSGGGDSLALLFLLKSFLDLRAPRVRLLAVTVDHGLRAASAGEAEAVAALCRLHAVDHQTVRWSGEKPFSGIMAAARDARYRLLGEAAIEAGTDLVMTGHTRDDQAETVAMRLRRSGEGGGLSGMAGATLHDESVWFCRPLLDVRRAALRDHLARLGVGWTDDPTNDDADYERARVRASLDDRGVEELALRASDAARVRIELASRAGLLIDRHVRRDAPGLFSVEPALLAGGALGSAGGGADVAAVHALRAVLATVGGTPHMPDVARVRTLAERLANGRMRATLSRVAIDGRRGAVWLRREARDLPTIGLGSGVRAWDGRWRIDAPADGTGLTVGPAERGPMQADGTEPAGASRSLLESAFSAEPCLFSDGVAVGHPGGEAAAALGVSARPVVAFQTRYLPSYDLALAAALRRLLGLGDLPETPWKDHIDADA